MDAKTKELMDKQIRNELNSLKGEFKNTMLNGMPKMHKMKIVKLTNKELTLQIDNGKEMPFDNSATWRIIEGLILSRC